MAFSLYSPSSSSWKSFYWRLRFSLTNRVRKLATKISDNINIIVIVELNFESALIMKQDTFNISNSGIAYRKLIKFPKNPSIAMVVLSLMGKHNSQENSNVRAMMADEPHTKKYMIKKNTLFTCIDMIRMPNNTVTKPLHILNTNLNDFVFLIAVPTQISPINPAMTPANTKLL